MDLSCLGRTIYAKPPIQFRHSIRHRKYFILTKHVIIFLIRPNMTFLRQLLAKRLAAPHKFPYRCPIGLCLNHRGSAAGLYTEPPAHRKPSGIVTNSTLGLLLPNNQGKHLHRSQLQGTTMIMPG